MVGDQILTERQAADYTCVPRSRLAKLRMKTRRRHGPCFIKIGRSVRYRRSDLDKWLARNTVRVDE